MKRKKSIGFGGWFIIIAIFALLVSSLMPAFIHLDRETYTVTITGKAVKRYDKEDKYLVFAKTEDGKFMEFENTDSWLELKFNSSSIQGRLEVGRKYRVRVYGWRIPLLSWYPNIVKAQKAE